VADDPQAKLARMRLAADAEYEKAKEQWMSINFSESFQLTDKLGVVHSFTLSGTLDDKPEIVKTSAEAIKAALGKGWTVVTKAAVAPLSTDPNSSTETIMAEQLIVSVDENGTHFKVKGGKYKKHGVAVYPEYLEELGIDKGLKPGAHIFKKKVVILTGEKGSKVIALG
jgi:hypothetical protein